MLVRARREGDLAVVAAALRRARPPLLIVGRGSNLLVADAGFPGLALVLEGEFEEIAPGEGTVTRRWRGRAAGARAPGRGPGWPGSSSTSGIPGTVGGAVRMNAGGHGQETREVLRLRGSWTCWATGWRSTGRSTSSRSATGPRPSDPTTWSSAATFAVDRDEPAACEARIAEVVRWRREHQPGGANAGSVFRNPPGDSAGRLIDGCGLKGLRVGGAVVSDKHANFIQAETGATAADVRDLVPEVQRRVADATGVELQPELHFVGFEAPEEERS